MDLVVNKRGDILADSRMVAEKFGKSHKHVIDKIEKLKEELVADNLATQKLIKKEREYRGQFFKYYEFDRDFFSFLVMSFTGRKALRWKHAYNNAFNEMERRLLNQANEEWKAERIQGQFARKQLTDTIKDFVAYAKSQGSKNAERYYSNITKMEYKALHLIEKNEKVTTEFRDKLDMLQLHQLTLAEMVAKKTISLGMNQKLHYKEIFIEAKNAVLKYADSMLMLTKQIEEP